MECFELGHKKNLIQFIPNKYRTLNPENSGFNTQFLKLEKSCSLAALICFVIGMIFSGCYYALTKATTTYQEFDPTPEKYIDFTKTKDIVGKPACPCQTTIIKKGIFLKKVDFEIDSVCSINKTLAHASYGQELQKHYYILNIPPPPAALPGTAGAAPLPATPPQPYYICPNIDNKTEAAQDCAVINHLARRFLEDLYAECDYVKDVHWLEADLLKKEKFYTVNAMDKQVLTSYLVSEFDSHALRMGMSELARTTGTFLLQSQSDWSNIKTINSRWSHLSTFSTSCPFISNKDSTKFMLTTALQECLTSNSFSYRCCKEKGANCTNSAYLDTLHTWTLHCTPPMVELARRFNSSQYSTMGERIKNAFLENMEDIDSRINITSGGYYVTAAALQGAWEDYFRACNPEECHYVTYGYPDAQAVLLILSGLVGGIWGVVLNGCLVSLVAVKKYILYSKRKKQDTVVPEPAEKETHVEQLSA